MAESLEISPPLPIRHADHHSRVAPRATRHRTRAGAGAASRERDSATLAYSSQQYRELYSSSTLVALPLDRLLTAPASAAPGVPRSSQEFPGVLCAASRRAASGRAGEGQRIFPSWRQS